MREPAFRVAWFLLFTAIITGVVIHLNAHGSFGKAGSLAMMWCPAVAALGASLVTRRSLKEVGWRPQPKWIAIGWLLPIGYAFLAYGGVWLARIGSVPNPTFLSRARLTLNMAHSPDRLVIIAAFGFITVCLLPPSMISARSGSVRRVPPSLAALSGVLGILQHFFGSAMARLALQKSTRWPAFR